VTDKSHVQGTGYARSKYVAEHIVHNAARDSGAQARVLRIGQLAGDTAAGDWNTTEGIPLMIQTAVTLGALPKLDEEMSWLPVDTAASIILDLTSAQHTDATDPSLVYHVVNPHRFHWTRDMLPAFAAGGLEFEALEVGEWMKRLRASDRDAVRNPPIKLLDWFESKYGEKAALKPSAGPLVYETARTERDSETLKGVPDVRDKAYVGRMVGRLRGKWGMK
jgi:thioester reductase-like protein